MKKKKEFTKKQLKNKLGKCIEDKYIARAKIILLKNKKKSYHGGLHLPVEGDINE